MARRQEPVDAFGRPLRIGDWARLIALPTPLPAASRSVFRRALGLTFRIEGFGRHGHAELDLTRKVARSESIWVEPCLLRRTRARRRSGPSWPRRPAVFGQALRAMIRLRESILIQVPPERVWAWLNELPLHYREWHPAHVDCRYECGRSLEVGAVLYLEEYLHDRLHRLRVRATDVVPGRELRYRGHAFAGAFFVEEVNGRTCFTAELTFGLRTPVLGDLVDAVVRWVLARRLATIQTHMREEAENLKRLLEGELAA